MPRFSGQLADPPHPVMGGCQALGQVKYQPDLRAGLQSEPRNAGTPREDILMTRSTLECGSGLGNGAASPIYPGSPNIGNLPMLTPADVNILDCIETVTPNLHRARSFVVSLPDTHTSRILFGVAMPGHRRSRRGCFCTEGSSLNDWGAGRRERRFYYASESIRSGTRRPTQAHREL